MQSTTIAGFITALALVVFWALSTFWTIVVPPEVQTFVGTLGISIVALFADPNSIKRIPAAVFSILTTALTIFSYIMTAIAHIAMPDTIIAALQVIGIMCLSYFIQDSQNKNKANSIRAP